MKKRYLIAKNESVTDKNIYADKSALVIDWLLRIGREWENVSVRSVSAEVGVSVGLVQKIFQNLILKGILISEGTRTSKKFYLKKPGFLLKDWVESYDITKKCGMKTYRSAYGHKKEIFEKLIHTGLSKNIFLALHTAAESYGVKHTNLNTVELYVTNSNTIAKLEKELHLEHQEKGYEILLIKPYYKHLLRTSNTQSNEIQVCPLLLTYLDLYHFPLRGREQADYMALHCNELKKILKK